MDIRDIPTRALAVTIRNAYKTFKTKGKHNAGCKVLENFSMTVQTGHLYSLLGSSGCGKTTVLSCLVGALKLDKGNLSVFGSKTVPVSPNRWQRVGYMPQEISLYPEFTVFETLMYFGKLFDMGGKTSKGYLLGRIQFLRELLALPDDLDRTVGTLSGGQQRRVSFAVALVNEPDLLLLDEITSGVDPLIRKCIWDHLVWLANTKGTTIILTTHYVDEARGSDTVGVMRDGRMIAEDSPTNILSKYGVDSLETAFLQLCKQQEDISSSTMSPAICLTNHPTINRNRALSRVKSLFPIQLRVEHSGKRVMALAYKNLKTLTRNLWMLAFTTLMPAFSMLVIMAAMQKDPRGIRMGVVNQDVQNGDTCFHRNLSSECMTGQFSCKFIEEILSSDTITLKSYDFIEQAREAVFQGNIWGFVYFPKNYTTSVMGRAFKGAMKIDHDGYGDEQGDGLWNSSKITVNLDSTNTMIYSKILSTLYDAFEKSAKRSLRDCGWDERNGQFPLQYGEPVLGEKDSMTSLDYVAPGLAILLLVFCPATVCIRYILEKRQGTMDRCIAGGTQPLEIIVAYAIPEFGVLVCQFSLVYLTLYYGCSIGPSPLEAPMIFPFIITICVLSGMVGLSVGLLMGVILEETSQAAMMMIALIFPCAYLSGIFWVSQGMPPALQMISQGSPMTLPVEALRSMMIRRWGITHPRVWPAFAIAIFYIALCSLLTIWIIKRQKK